MSTERGLQEVLEQEQAEPLGRSRYERQPAPQGDRNGYEDGLGKTAEGVCRFQRPPVRGLREPYRSKLWAALGRTRAGLSRLSVEMSAGGRSPRDIESALEKALGQFVVSQSAVSDMTERLSHEYEAFRTRELRGFALAYLCMDTVYEPRRRWGSKTGILCAWGICVEGRQVLLTLSTAHSASYERGLEVLRALGQRGLQTPITLTPDGAPGVIQAIEARGPRSLRMRCWFHQRQHLQQTVPPPAWPALQALIAAMRDAPPCEEGQCRQQALLAQSHAPLPAACRCLEDDAEARLNHRKVPARHRQYVRPSHLAERAVAEDRRRTKGMPHLWDEAS